MSQMSFRGNASAYFKRIKQGAGLNVMVNLVNSFAVGFASFFFQQQGVQMYKIILIWAISPLVSLPIVYFINQWNTKRFLRLGVLAYAGSVLSLLFYMPYSWLLFGIFEGLKLGLFWVSFNTSFFNKSNNHQHAKDSSLYFIFPTLGGIIMPPLGALVIDNFGYKVLFSIALLLCIAPFLYIQGKYFDYRENMTFKQADKAFSGIRTIVFFDSAIHFFQWHFMTIYALLFIKTEYAFGGLLSYLALISLFVSFALSAVSDRYHKRAELLYPLLFVMAILIVIMPSFKTLATLVPIIGLYTVFDNLSLPIRFAAHIDLGTKDTGFWRAGEFYGNIGRTVVFAISALFLYIGNYWLPFIMFASMTAALPFIIQRKLNRQTLPVLEEEKTQ